jgi:pyruvate, water dikinase
VEKMADKERAYTIWYNELGGRDFPLVGRKNADLGDMIKAGIRVSPGFAVTISANEKFMADTGIKGEVGKYLEELGKVTYDTTRKASRFIIKLIEEAAIPGEIEEDILTNYRKLCEMSNTRDVPVAVRSSEAIPMPGLMDTYLNIRGAEDLITYVKRCWGSAYTGEAITYRANKGMGFLFNMSVGIPKMVNSRVSGILYTINPVNGDTSKMMIEASYGLGEAITRRLVTPDAILVDKSTTEVVKTTIGAKDVKYVYRDQGSDIVHAGVPEDMREKVSLNGTEIAELCRLGRLIEDYYGRAYDIEFGIDGDLPFPDNIIVLQVRPESVWTKRDKAPRTGRKRDPMEHALSQLLAGNESER